MSAWFRKLRKTVRKNPQLKIIFIGIPCLGIVVMAALAVLGNIADKRYAYEAETDNVAEPVEIASAVKPAEKPEKPKATPAVTEAPEKKKCMLKTHSSERDMFVQVCTDEGELIEGIEFEISVSYPDGDKCNFTTDETGGYYIVDLEPGEYSVIVNETDEYLTSVPVVCNVKGELAHKVIQDITSQTEVVTSDQVKDAQPVQEAVPTVYAKEITTPEEKETDKSGWPIVYDKHGNVTYTYTYLTGSNGFLLYSQSGEESDVKPVEEDGKLSYGLRRVVRYFFKDGSVSETKPDDSVSTELYYPEESSQEVTLINADNTPVADYAITAEPIRQAPESEYGWRTSEDGKIYYYDTNKEPVKNGLKKIDGKFYYFNADGTHAQSVGIDVSSYNHDINWGMVKSAGIDFAIIRVGGRSWYDPGTLYDDTKFADNIGQASRAGVKVGVYFYSTAKNCNEAIEEASLVVNRLNGRALDLPIFIDVENSGIYPNGRSDILSQDKTEAIKLRTEIIKAFCETVNSAGYAAGYYSGQSFMTYKINMSQLTQYTVWMASYTDEQKKPENFTNHYDIWQCTDCGFVNGVNGCVDIDIMW